MKLEEFNVGDVACVLGAVIDEIERATRRYGPATTRHDAMGILLEEVDETWDAVKANQSAGEIDKELIQVAAMAVRFAAQLRATDRKEMEHEEESVENAGLPTHIRRDSGGDSVEGERKGNAGD